VSICDFNEDDRDDIAVIDGDSVKVYYRDLSGTFVRLFSAFIGAPAADVTPKLVSSDFNLDRIADLVAVVTLADSTAFSVVSVLLGDGTGNVLTLDTISVHGKVFDLTQADFNNDRRPDFAITNSTVGEVAIYLGNGDGTFDGPFTVTLDAGTDVGAVLAAADLDRDGNSDFISGISGGGEVVVATNDGADENIIPDEMFITAFRNATLTVLNPDSQIISRNVRTVAGSDYRRFDYDGDGYRDEQSMDYNAKYGEYEITAELRQDIDPGQAGVSVAIGIDGSQQFQISKDLSGGTRRVSSESAAETFTFHFPLEETQTIFPGYGLPSFGLRPTFDWSLRVETLGATEYEFQLDVHPAFPAPRVYRTGLADPQYLLESPLGEDSVFYWRYRSFEAGGWSDWSHEFAVLATANCCQDVTGNVNCDPQETVDISDLTTLVNYLFVTFDALCCPEEANTDGDINGKVDISDLTKLVNTLFVTFEPLALCQ
jgi:hypothetical protein